MKSWHGIIFLIGMGIIVVVLLIKSAGPRITDISQLPASEKKLVQFPVGSRVRLIFEDNELIPIYRTLSDFQEGMRIANNNDKSGAAALILDKRVFFAPMGTIGRVDKITSMPDGRYLVISNGREGWVPLKMLYETR
jgi:hypothetical protein